MFLLFKMILFIICLYSFSSYASYPQNYPNQGIKEERLNGQKRLIPSSEHFNFLVDGQVFARDLGEDEFYHGLGHWVQLRSEVRPHEHFSLNMRSIFYSGSVSSGYTNPSGQYHLFSFNGIWPNEILGATLKGQAIDLGRQGAGEGLLIQNKEMSGLKLNLSSKNIDLIMIGNGTGTLVTDDDTIITEISIFKRLFVFGGVFFAKDNVGLTKKRDDYHFISSRIPFSTASYLFTEAGQRANKNAYLLGFGHKNKYFTDHFSLDLKLQGRDYKEGFGEGFVGLIQHNYVSYDQLDKDFTDAMNIFVFDDGVFVTSIKMDMQLMINQYWSLESLNEWIVINFKNSRKDEDFYFYRLGIIHHPKQSENESLNLFVSNKILNDSFKRPPIETSSQNMTLFRERTYVGLEAKFSF